MDAIRSHPGVCFRELTRITQLAFGTVRHHLNILHRHGRIRELKQGNSNVIFEAHAVADSRWPAIALLREARRRQLFEFISSNAFARQRDILRAFARQGWKRTTTQNRLRRLEKEGLIGSVRQGKAKVYRIMVPFAASAPTGLIEKASPLAP